MERMRVETLYHRIPLPRSCQKGRDPTGSDLHRQTFRPRAIPDRTAGRARP